MYSSKDFVDKVLHHHVLINVNNVNVFIVSQVQVWHQSVVHAVRLVAILATVVVVLCV